MNVVLYLRYSSANQTEQSIEGQDRVCTEFCKKQGYEIVYGEGTEYLSETITYFLGRK